MDEEAEAEAEAGPEPEPDDATGSSKIVVGKWFVIYSNGNSTFLGHTVQLCNGSFHFFLMIWHTNP